MRSDALKTHLEEFLAPDTSVELCMPVLVERADQGEHDPCDRSGRNNGIAAS
jgi:hypothetical protein